MEIEKNKQFKVNNIFFLSNGSTVLAIENDFNIDFFDLENCQLFLNGEIFKTIKIDKELVLKGKTKNRTKIALETFDDISRLKDLDLNMNEIFLMLNLKEGKSRFLLDD